MVENLRYRVIAIDLDGTLLDSQHELPARNRAALHRAHEAGMKVVLCTGRSFPETQPVIQRIGLDLDAAITAGGAILTEVATGRTIERSPIPLDESRELSAWFQRRGYAVLWLFDRNDAGFDGYAIHGPRRHFAFDRWLEMTPCIMTQIDGLPRGGFTPLRITIVDDTAALEGVSEALKTEFGGRIAHNVLRVPRYDLTVIECFAGHVNKWYGIRRLCELWGLDTLDTVAVGDDVNDVEMVKRAGLGVAMANAHPAVKDVALRVTQSNDECGVAVLIDHLFSAAESAASAASVGVAGVSGAFHRIAGPAELTDSADADLEATSSMLNHVHINVNDAALDSGADSSEQRA